MKTQLYKKKARGFFRPVNIITIWLSAMVLVLSIQTLGLSSSEPVTLAAESVVTANSADQQQHSDIFSDLASSAEAISIDNADFNISKNSGHEKRWITVRMKVTAYCPCAKCCGRFADGRTADGHKIHWGDRFVAAPKNIAFGTEMIIPGYNHNQPVKVKDRGRVIKNNRLDVFYNTHHTASRWGVQYLDVKIKI